MQSGFTASDYERFCRYLENACGITLDKNKGYLVRSRIGRLVDESYGGSLGALVSALEGGASLTVRARVIDAMTTNETLWFRDGHPFTALTEMIFPEFSTARTNALRIWSAASSTGQEPYSISISIAEYLAAKPGALPKDIEIIATDISPSVLQQARAGVYDQFEIARGLSPERQKRFFVPTGESMQVRGEIARRVQFRELNLLHGYTSLGPFDVVFLRNVLIYFSNENKKLIISKIVKQLKPRGFLFLGGSEPLGNYSTDFEMVRYGRGVVYRLKSPQ